MKKQRYFVPKPGTMFTENIRYRIIKKDYLVYVVYKGQEQNDSIRSVYAPEQLIGDQSHIEIPEEEMALLLS